jgi:hypothetical protein
LFGGEATNKPKAGSSNESGDCEQRCSSRGVRLLMNEMMSIYQQTRRGFLSEDKLPFVPTLVTQFITYKLDRLFVDDVTHLDTTPPFFLSLISPGGCS